MFVFTVAEANPQDNLNEQGVFSRWAGSIVLCMGVWWGAELLSPAAHRQEGDRAGSILLGNALVTLFL